MTTPRIMFIHGMGEKPEPEAEGRLIVDRRVRDNYAPDGDRDPHHWHGYLTSPELVDIVCHFWLGNGGSTAGAGPTQPSTPT